MNNAVKSQKKIFGWWLEIIIIVVGVIIASWAFIAGPPEQWGPFLAASAGLLFSMCGIISFLLRYVLSDTTKETISRMDWHAKEIISRMDWKWSFDPQANWKCATQIIHTVLQNGQECYETSSIANSDDYEQEVLQLANVWVADSDTNQVFTRIYCFADNSRDDKERKCRQVFHQVLDPKFDGERKYAVVRDCIRMGKIRVLHLPYRLLTDYLIVKTKNGEYDCLIGLAPPKTKKFLTSARICNEEVGDKLFRHLEHIMALAIDNCEKNSNGKKNESSCSHYKYNHELKTLLPN